MSVRLFLIRHGETAWSRSGQHTSRTDLPLLPEGEAEARWLKPRLAGHTFTHAYCSPRLRARQTAEIAGFGDRLITEPDLREWEYGDYEGITAPAIREKRPDWNIYRDGCPGGESAEEISSRADCLVHRLRWLSGDIALFSHGHFLRVFATRWIGAPILQAGNLGISVASLGLLGLTHENPPRHQIELWNERGPGHSV
jgi:probable phosphoglycerate mutase